MKSAHAELKETSAEIAMLLKLLAQTPRRITTASRGLDNTRLIFRPDENTWSANDILAHLRACADVWGKYILAMISQDHPTLRTISPRTWIRKTDYPKLEFHQSLQAFTRQRNDLLKALKPLPITDWSRGATFTAATSAKNREQTILSNARRITQHETEHCEQIEMLLKSV